LIASGRAAEREIDPTRIKGFKRAELLGDNERRVIGKHDSARTDADAFRSTGDVTDHDRGGRAGDAGHVVMLSQPVAMVLPIFRMAGEVECVAKCLPGVAALDHRGKVEDRVAHGKLEISRLN
jgi:hypothetical protein